MYPWTQGVKSMPNQADPVAGVQRQAMAWGVAWAPAQALFHGCYGCAAAGFVFRQRSQPRLMYIKRSRHSVKTCTRPGHAGEVVTVGQARRE